MQENYIKPKTEYERKNEQLSKFLLMVLGLWFICNAALVSIVILISPKETVPAHVIQPQIVNRETPQRITRPVITNGPHNVIFNDFTLLQKTPDGEPYPDNDFIPAGKATDVIIVERTSGEIGGVKWYKVRFAGNRGRKLREGWVPEYGIIETGERRIEINKIREHEMRLRGYIFGLDFRGKWTNPNGTVLLANIDLSYLIVIYKSGVHSFKLERLVRKRRNVFRLTADGGIWMDIVFKNNRFHSISNSRFPRTAGESIRSINLRGNYKKETITSS